MHFILMDVETTSIPLKNIKTNLNYCLWLKSPLVQTNNQETWLFASDLCVNSLENT